MAKVLSEQTIHYEYKETNASKVVHIYRETEQISNNIAKQILSLSIECIAKNGTFHVAFSGGSLPKIVSQGLLRSDINEKIHWRGWHIYYADERLVKLDNKDSNHGEVKKHLLDKLPKDSIPIQNIHTLNEKLISNPNECALDYQEQIVKSLNGKPQFDLILLGMGPDGHCCSLFPTHPLLYEKDRLVTYITDSPKPPPQRITFTLPLVNQAKHVWFVVTGREKQESLVSVIEKPQEGLPSALVKSADLRFYIDADAGRMLKLSKL